MMKIKGKAKKEFYCFSCNKCLGEFYEGYDQYGNGKLRRRFCSIECEKKWRSVWYSEHKYGSFAKKPREKLVCEQCNKEFEVIKKEGNKRKYCSNECQGLAWRGKNHPNWITKVRKYCYDCNKEIPKFLNIRSTYKDGRERKFFCSEKCRSKWFSQNAKETSLKHQVVLTCDHCKKEYSIARLPLLMKNRHYNLCNDQCRLEFIEKMLKEKGSSDITPYYQEYQKNRRKCLKRDDYTCRICGFQNKNGGVQAHHINKFMISFDNSLLNLATLCISCHKILDLALTNETKEGIRISKNLIKENNHV